MGQWTVEEPKNVKWFGSELKTASANGREHYTERPPGEAPVYHWMYYSFYALTTIGRTPEDKICYRIGVRGSNTTGQPVSYGTSLYLVATDETGALSTSTIRVSPDGWFGTDTWATVSGENVYKYVYYILDSEPSVEDLKAGAKGVDDLGNTITNTYSIPHHYGNQLWLPTSDGWKRAQLWIPVDGTWKMGFFKPKVGEDWK